MAGVWNTNNWFHMHRGFEVVDRGLVVDIIYLAISRASDVVSHSIILKNLKILGVGSKLLVWIHEFLFGCILCVKVAKT